MANVIVFVNDRKVLYKAGAPGGGKVLSFATQVNLKEGVNQILVIAQDDQKLVTRRRAVVLREEVPAVARRGGEQPLASQ